jgi:hypothetical protein
MASSPYIVALLVAIALLLATAATRAVLRNESLSGAQRALQLAFIWLVPGIGPLVCLAVDRSIRGETSMHVDRTAFVDSADAGGSSWDVVPGSDIRGCSDVGSSDCDGD